MEASEYRNLFQNLNVNRSGNKTAPHKAILLLSILDMVEDGSITSPFIPLSHKLSHVFKENWNRYIPPQSSFTCKLNYPFFHLSSSPFWKLKKLDTYEDLKEYSMTALKKSFSGASIPSELFDLLKQPVFRNEIRRILIATYIDRATIHKPTPFSTLSALLIATLVLSIA